MLVDRSKVAAGAAAPPGVFLMFCYVDRCSYFVI
jgi:hypothetical protein